MKKLTLLIATVPFILAGCYREPYADFFASQRNPYVNEMVRFTNTSMDADYFEWDFGDGTMAFTYDAHHAYVEPGSYTVSLTAFNRDRRVDRAFMSIDVTLPATELTVTVLEYYDEYAVEDASVILYRTLDDWIDEYDPLVEGFTDYYGDVIFTDLQSRRYYVDVWEEYHNNYTLADEDVGFIETDILEPNAMNYFIAWVDYVEPVKKSSGRDRSLKLKKLEKVDKRTFEEKSARAEELINAEKETREQ